MLRNLQSGVARITRKFRPRGIGRLLHWLYPPGAQKSGEIVMAYDDGLLIHVNTALFIEWSIFFYGHYEPEISRLIKRLLRPGSLPVMSEPMSVVILSRWRLPVVIPEEYWRLNRIPLFMSGFVVI